MTRINPRNVQNKTGVTFNAGSLTYIFAEDYKVFSDTLKDAGSEVYLWLYNVNTAQRDALSPQTGHIVYNTSIGSIQFYNGTSWANIDNGISQGILPIGSIPNLSGSYIPQGIIPYGSITSALPQGVLPVGSIPTLIAYLPQGTIPVGSLSAVIPQGIIPYGSLVNALPQGIIPLGSIPTLTAYIPQGVLPIGSLPSLTSLYIPQGQLPTGSLPNNIIISGSVNASYGSFTGNIVAGSLFGYGGNLTGINSSGVTQVYGTTNRITVTSGSIVDIASNYSGQNTITTLGTISTGTWNTGLDAGSLTSGTVNQGRLPNLSGSYIPQGTIPAGSIPTVLPQGVLPVGSIPTLNYISNGVIPIGSLGSVLPQGILPVGSIPTLTNYITQGIIPYGSLVNALPQGVLPTGSLPSSIIISNDLQANDGSFSGSVIIAGSTRGVYGSFTGNLFASNLSGTNTGDQTNISGSALLSLPQGVLPTGSIPSLSSLYIPQGTIPYGSLKLSLPQGVLPVGSIPTLTAYIPQGQLITGSLPNTITISQDMNARHGSFTGSLTSGSLVTTGNIVVSGSLYGYGGTLSGIGGGVSGAGVNGSISVWSSASNITYYNASIDANANARFNGSITATNGSFTGSVISAFTVAPNLLPQGTIPVGSVPGVIPQGVLPYGSLTNALPQGVLPSGSIPTLNYISNGVIPIGSLGSVLPQGVLPTGSIPSLTSLYIPQGAIPYGSLKLSLPQGVLPVGSIPSLTAYIPQGVIPAGSLVNSLPQGQVPVGSLSAVLPQGVLPSGSIPSLTSLYVPQGQFVNGSMPNTISISGSLVSPYGSHSGSLIAGFGVIPNLLPQGVLPVGSIPSLTAYIPQGTIPYGSLINALPQGTLPNGSLPSNITITGSMIASYGSITGNLVAGSLYGYGGTLTGISGGLTGAGLNGSIAVWTSSTNISYQNASIDSNGNARYAGSIVATQFNGSLDAGSIFTGTINQGRLPNLNGSYIPQGTIPAGSVPTVIPQGVLPYGSLIAALPQGILPVGSIPTLTAYIPQGVIPSGSLTNALPQGVLPVGSIPTLTAYIPQGVIPAGSLINSLPQGVLPNGSLPSNITITGSMLNAYGSTSGNYVVGNDITANDIGLTGSVAAVTGSFTGSISVGGNAMVSGNLGLGQVPDTNFKLAATTTSGTRTASLVNSNTGTLAYGLHVTKSGAAGSGVGIYSTASGGTFNYAAIFDQGNVGVGNTAPSEKLDITGNTRTSGSFIGASGSFSGNIIAGSYIGFGGLLTGISSSGGGGVGSSALGVIGSIATWSNTGSIQPVNIAISGANLTTTGSLQAAYGSFSGNVISNGSYYGWGGTLTGVTASAAPAGSSTTIQFNDGGTGSGDSSFAWNKSESRVYLNGRMGITSQSNNPTLVITGSATQTQYLTEWKNQLGSNIFAVDMGGKMRFGTGNAYIGSADGFPNRMRIDGGTDTLEMGNLNEIYFSDGKVEFELYQAGNGSVRIRNQGGGRGDLQVQNNIISETGSLILQNSTTTNDVDIYATTQQSPFLWIAGSSGRRTLWVQPAVNTKLNLQEHRANNGATITSVGMNLTSRGTVSHSTPSITVPYGFGYVTGAAAGSTVGFFGTTNLYHRGQTSANVSGFAMVGRAFYTDASYGSMVTFLGFMPSASVPALLSSMIQNTAANMIGFQYSLGSLGGRTDTNWQFVSRDTGATMGSIDTGMPFAAGSVYDFSMYVPPVGSTAYWSITDFQRQVTVQGSYTGLLPGSITMLTVTGLMTNVSATARTVRYNNIAAWTT